MRISIVALTVALLSGGTARTLGQGPPTQEYQEPTTVQIVDLAAQLAELTRIFADGPDWQQTYYQSRFGSVAMHLMSYRQIFPLHLHRFAHVASTVVSGEVEMLQTCGAGEATKVHMQKHAPGSIVYSPPFCGHKWVNPSESTMQAILVFASLPVVPPVDTNVYVDGDDDRLLDGREPVILEVEDELQSLLAGDEPFRQRRLPMMNGKLSNLTVAGTAKIEVRPGPTFVYVVAGRGFLEVGQRHRIQSQRLVFIPRNTPFAVRAEPGAPLSLIVFRPEDDGVGDILREGKKLYSQDQEELVIREFFRDRRNGVFLDVGAADYKRDSTTFYLEEKLGWSGVAVDALAEFEPGYLEHRKNTRFVNYLITDKARGKQKFYRATKYLEVSSVSRKVAQDQAKLYRGDDTVTELEVPTITLTELLNALEIEKIDFLSMDIEEHEPAALAGFEIDRFRPELVCIEAHRLVQDAIYKYFTEHGYVRLDRYLSYDRYNWYFTPESNLPDGHDPP